MRESHHGRFRNPAFLIFAGLSFGFIFAMFRIAYGVPPGLTPPVQSGEIRRVGNRIGIGFAIADADPANTVSVKGNMSVGVGYESVAAGTNNLLVQGSVGIGTSNVLSKLSLGGGNIIMSGVPQRFFPNERIPRGGITTTISAANTKTSGAIGVDGNPIVAYVRPTTPATELYLEAIHCRTSDCTSYDGPLVVAQRSSLNNVNGGGWTSLAIGNDGFPIISYGDEVSSGGATDFRLRIAKCLNIHCGAGAIVTDIVDPESPQDYGEVSRIAIGTDGFPVVAYIDVSNGRLKAFQCLNASCSSYGTIYTLDSGLVGSNLINLEMDIGVDGLPFITYAKTNSVMAIHCSTPSCSSASAPATIATLSSGGISFTSMSRGWDGLPIIAYQKFGGASPIVQIMVVKCGNLFCSSGNSVPSQIYGVNPPPDIYGLVIAISANGYPIVHYNYNPGSGFTSDLFVARCFDQACQKFATALTEDFGSGETAIGRDLLVGSDGLPMVVYTYITTAGNFLRFRKCGSENCSPYWTRR